AWEKIAAVLVAARLCEPSSELHIAEDWFRRTALTDLLQLRDAEVNKDRLYRALDRLVVHKAAIESHLSRRAGELFAVQHEVLLYDVTSAYFEGEAATNPLAQRGYSFRHLSMTGRRYRKAPICCAPTSLTGVTNNCGRPTSNSPRPKRRFASKRISSRCARSGTSAPIALRPISWSASWPSYCGRPSRSGR